MENQIKSTKTLSYVIWGSVILAGLYLLYRRSGVYKQRKLNSFAKKYPGWEINNQKGTLPIEVYAKNFKATSANGSFVEYWLIYYNDGSFAVYTRSNPEKLISLGTWPNDTTIKIREGLKSGQTIKGKTINDMLNKLFQETITGI